MLAEYESLLTKDLPCFPERFLSKENSLVTKIAEILLTMSGRVNLVQRNTEQVSVLVATQGWWQPPTDVVARIWK